MTYPTLLDIAKTTGTDAVVGLIDETTKVHPEITKVAARTIKGQNYKTLVRVGLPTVGFRYGNEGTAASKGAYINRLVETFILNPRWECDKAVADVCEDGPESYIALEGSGMVEAAMQALASQFYYGVSTDAKGFPGLLAAYDSVNMVVDAGGTTESTCSSVWAVRFGPKDVQWVYGNNGQLALSPVTQERVIDASLNPFTAYCQEILAYPGLQVGSVRSLGRIKKLTADSGKGLTDSLLSTLFMKFPVGFPPDAYFMTRRSLAQLQSSRTATTPTGQPAPYPTSGLDGVPIFVTDALINTETLAL